MAENPQDPQDEESAGQYAAEEGYEENQAGQALGRGPAVAAPPGKTMMIAVAGVLLVGFVIYQLFFGSSDKAAPPPPERAPAAAPVAQADSPIGQLPAIPAPTPEPLPPPPLPIEESVPPLPPPPSITPDQLPLQGPTNEQQMARRKSNMLVMGGAGAPEMDAGMGDTLGNAMIVGGEGDGDLTPNSPAPRAVATHVGDLRKLILQGKIIHSVLETAIDTTFPGPIRGLVARDVYAESVKDILIPKGSRLIGNYNADVVRGQARVFIIWNRMIRPDGVDIDLSSPAVDRLGRAGLEGFVDNRYFEIFTDSALTSVFTIGMAAMAQKVFDAGDVTTTQDPQGGATQTGDPTSIAIQGAVESMSSLAQSALGGLIDMRPLITVDQGAEVNIFVNKDLEFPDEVTKRIKLVQ